MSNTPKGETNHWCTPAWFVEMVRNVLGEIDLDPAGSVDIDNVKAACKLVEPHGLQVQWKGRVFLNPPFGRGIIDRFVNKACAEWLNEVDEMIVLVNADTSTQWFHNLLVHAISVCFTRGRMEFEHPTRGNSKNRMGQAVFYFGSKRGRFEDVFSDLGFVVRDL